MAVAAQAAEPVNVPDNAASRGVIVLQPKAEAPAEAPPAPVVAKPAVVPPRAAVAVAPPPPAVPVKPVSAKPVAVKPAPVKVAAPVAPLAVAPVIKNCARPFGRPDLRLANDNGFARALSARLRRGQRVVVDLAQPYAEKADAPALLSPWFAKVKESGGTVDVKHYCQSSRGFGSWLSSLFKADPSRIYRPASNYNVLLHSDGLDRIVTQVEFVPKKAG